MHQHVRELSGKRAQPESSGVSSASVTVSLHAIGGFHQLSTVLPPRGKRQLKQWTVDAAERNGLNPSFPDGEVHVLAAEPDYTVLRVSVADEGQEVAYDTAVLGTLRPGVRCLELRSVKYGTRIELCTLLVEVQQ